MTRTVEPVTVVHPAWCSLARCTVSPANTAGTHTSEHLVIGPDKPAPMSVVAHMYRPGRPDHAPARVILEIDRDTGGRPVVVILSSRQTLDLVRSLTDLMSQKESAG